MSKEEAKRMIDEKLESLHIHSRDGLSCAPFMAYEVLEAIEDLARKGKEKLVEEVDLDDPEQDKL